MALKSDQKNNYPQIVPLLPCPFCGGEAYYYINTKGTFSWMSVQCIKCGAAPYGAIYSNGISDEEKQSALAERWNRRYKDE